MATRPGYMLQREDDVVSQFTGLVREAMIEHYDSEAGIPTFAASPLGGQDFVLADYLLARVGQFCLIEFKDRPGSVSRERNKPLRQSLCIKLLADSTLLACSEDAHFLAWREKSMEYTPSTQREELILDIALSAYAYRVARLFNIDLGNPVFEKMDADAFIRRFIVTELIGASAERFDRYVSALYEIAAGDSEGKAAFQGTVYAFFARSVNSQPKLHAIQFDGLDHLYSMIKGDEHQRERSHSYSRPALKRDGQEHAL